MATLIRILFSCCLGGRRKEDDNGERERLLGPTGVNGLNTVQYTTLEPTPRDTEDELNQKVADLVSNGTNRMIGIGPGRFQPPYSSVSAQLSSSQAHLHADTAHIDSQQSSHSSPHSSLQPSSAYPHANLEAQTSEDGAFNASQSVTSLAQNNPSGPSALAPLGFGTGGAGAGAPTAIGRRFQIHRGRPPTRRGAAESNDVGTRTQANGVLSPAEAADEHIRTSEASPLRTADVDPPPTPSSPPLRIKSAQGESASRERTPDDNEKRQVHFKLPPQNDLLVEFDP